MLSNVTHSNSYFECNKKRGCIDQLYIELGFEHEVWHHYERNESRLILFFDYWNPDLRPEKSIWQPIQFDAYGNNGNLIPNL